MKPVIPPKIFWEYMGVDVGTAQYKELTREVHFRLEYFHPLRAVLDPLPARRKLERFRRALNALINADAALTDGDRALGGARQEGARLVNNLDIQPLVGRLTAALDEAFASLPPNDGRRGGRRTETTRDELVRDLAGLFQQHYKLAPIDYGPHLVKFLRRLLAPNKIKPPKASQTLLELLPQHLRRP